MGGCISHEKASNPPAPTIARFDNPVFTAAPAGKPYHSRRRNSVSAEADTSTVKYVPKVISKTADERAFLRSNVSGIFLFAGLSSSLLDELISAMEKRTVSTGEVLMAQGAEADNFYVVQSGNYHVIKDGKKVHQYVGQGFFGELALMYNTKRSASVEALTAGVVWAIDRPTFRHILTTTLQTRTKISQDVISRVTILSSLKPAERSKLGDALVVQEYRDGDTVIQQGDYGDKVFLIEEGNAIAYQNVVVGNATQRKEVFKHSTGDYFGERALIMDEPRAATVVARGALKVWTIDRGAFERLLGKEVKDQMAARLQTYSKASAK